MSLENPRTSITLQVFSSILSLSPIKCSFLHPLPKYFISVKMVLYFLCLLFCSNYFPPCIFISSAVSFTSSSHQKSFFVLLIRMRNLLSLFQAASTSSFIMSIFLLFFWQIILTFSLISYRMCIPAVVIHCDLCLIDPGSQAITGRSFDHDATNATTILLCIKHA